MGRRSKDFAETLALTYVGLRRADREDMAAIQQALDDAQHALEEAFEEESVSKADAAKRLRVSAQTVDTWTSRRLLPTVRAEGYQRERIPLQPLLALVAEVDDLRERGRKRGLLVEALARLEAEKMATPVAGAFDRSSYVSARPGADWHPED